MPTATRKRPAAESEPNTYRLPTGEPIRRQLRRDFRAQRQAVLAAIKRGFKDFDPTRLFDDFAGIIDPTTLPMAGRMSPLLEAYWDRSGRSFQSRVGLDPDAWQVTSPELAGQIDRAALEFCQATNATTVKTLDEAAADLRRELHEGLVERGDTVAQLTKRVNGVFENAETWRARRIAQTEASRAVHAALEQAAIKSGVVVGFEWLLSGDACPICVTIADQVKAVRIGHSFAVAGSHAAYSQVRHPPAHPHCACSMVEVLDTDDPPEWGETVDQPGSAEARPAPVTPAPEPEPPRPEPLAPGQPLLPGRPITERLAAYTEGDAKVRALVGIRSTTDATRAEVEALQAEFDALWLAPGKVTPERQERLKAANERLKAARARLTQGDAEVRAQVLGMIGSDRPMPIGAKTVGKSVPELDRDIAQGQAFVGRLVAADPSGQGLNVEYRPRSYGYRSHAQPNGRVDLAGDAGARTAAHELGHVVEYQLPTVGARARRFLEHRAPGEIPAKLADLSPGTYRPDEVGVDDDFGRYFSAAGSGGAFLNSAARYVGKRYRDSTTEVVAMGLEAMFVDAPRFAAQDPEFCKFILGILDGRLR